MIGTVCGVMNELHPQMFASYHCPWARRVTGLSFTTLVDVLSVFATMAGAELILRYPGPDDELICECAASLTGCIKLHSTLHKS